MGSLSLSLSLPLSLYLTPPPQSWGSMSEGQGSPEVQVFLASVEHFIGHLTSARLNMEKLFQLQPPEQQQDLVGALEQLGGPADYADAGTLRDAHKHRKSQISMMSVS